MRQIEITLKDWFTVSGLAAPYMGEIITVDDEFVVIRGVVKTADSYILTVEVQKPEPETAKETI